MTLLDVTDLTISVRVGPQVAPIIAGLSFQIKAGQCLGIVGESGSGKSSVALAVMGLLNPDALRVGGQIALDGTDLVTLSPPQMRARQGHDIAMIFQDPASSLNPVQRIGAQIVESLRAHRPVSRSEAARLAVEALGRVGMPDPTGMMNRYPHQLSGGQRQRVMIAMAVILKPRLLVADEPTTALDLTIQAQILALLKGLVRDTDMALLLITHDLGVVAEMADDLIVLYAGRAVETGPTRQVLDTPRHPYTIGLMAAHPSLDARQDRLTPIPGTPPRLWQRPKGCAFHPRCGLAQDACRAAVPPALVVRGTQTAACLRLDALQVPA
jgi:oligopeptide/dipeptide ABC transporter ATP-binding protein